MSAANQAVDKIEQHTGYNLRDDITNAWTKSQLEKGDTNGSRKTIAGGIVGHIGGPIGSAVGSLAGFTMDRYSGPMFKSALNGEIAIGNVINKLQSNPLTQKYVKPITDAAQRGNQSLAATMFILGQQDENFRKAMNEKE